ncbi:MAG: ABC transporter ATP-binding protein [Asgard group archaeon]|nr:ABC transporter ATP-binding protein [Asgard group archaeon]
MTKNIVVCKNLTKTFQVGNSTVQAVNGLSVNFKEGEFSSIVGPSGSGKTTLLNLIGTLEIPTTGSITINGTNLNKLTKADSPKSASKKGFMGTIKSLQRRQITSELTNFRRKNLGFVFQFFNLVEGLTSFENIELPLVFDSIPFETRKKKVDGIIEEFELDYLREKFPEELSSGERQRVAIMRALINDPFLLLADEPTGNLDTKTGQTILDLFQDLNKEKGTAIILVTHDLSAAKRARRILHMHDGKISFDQINEEPVQEEVE